MDSKKKPPVKKKGVKKVKKPVQTGTAEKPKKKQITKKP